MSLAISKDNGLSLGAYDYDLPEQLVAQRPLPARSASRLLALDGSTGENRDLEFNAIGSLLVSGDLLVFNNTKVIPARLFGRKASGGRVEFLIERIVDDHTALALAGSNKPLRIGHTVTLEKGNNITSASVTGRKGELFTLTFEDGPVADVLAALGHVPLPPYIRRPDDALDCDRYQTVFASCPGAVAAPTAGLHFDYALLNALEAQGVQHGFLTLHVGAGTFQPIRQQNITDHRLHAEWLSIPSLLCEQIKRAQGEGKKIVAVGTTSVRALETLARTEKIEPYEGNTDLFLYPGQPFLMVDAMITNFHLPRSSLLMLVCAYAGTDNTLKAYRHAVRHRYRFYSYGDAMFVTPHPRARLC